uniref:probable G-protein coupled receptor No18 n=1 Tax=Pristiophorus japonicus TaxID=55135 RepID=UPI00398EA326
MSNFQSLVPGALGSNSSGQQQPSLAATASQAILYLLIVIFGLPLNVLVLALVYKCRPLRSVTNMFVVSLALADFLIVLLGVPFIVIATVARSWPLGGTLCQMSGFLTTFLRNVSVLSVAGIAVDRYYVIARPFILTIPRDRARKMIVFLWWSGLLYGIPPLFGLGLYRFSPARCLCDYSWSAGGPSLAYGIYTFFWIYVTSLVTVTVSYYLIYRVTRDHLKHKAQRCTSNLSPGQGSGSILTELRSFRLLQASLPRKWTSFISSNSTVNLNANSTSDVAMESKTAKTIVAVITTCMVTWLPYFTLSFRRESLPAGRAPAMLDFLATWLSFANCVLNPVLYALLNRQFRRCAREYLRLWFGDPAQPSPPEVPATAGGAQNGSINTSKSRTHDGTSSAPFSVIRELQRSASPSFPGDSSPRTNPMIRPRLASFQRRAGPGQSPRPMMELSREWRVTPRGMDTDPREKMLEAQSSLSRGPTAFPDLTLDIRVGWTLNLAATGHVDKKSFPCPDSVERQLKTLIVL